MERRTADLASAGRTNKEIADTLFLSVRTVESQLSAAYRKLGIRSRAGLAAAFLQLDRADEVTLPPAPGRGPGSRSDHLPAECAALELAEQRTRIADADHGQ